MLRARGQGAPGTPADEIEARYGEIKAWEQRLLDQGTTIVKCALMVSLDEQLEGLELGWAAASFDVDVERARIAALRASE